MGACFLYRSWAGKMVVAYAQETFGFEDYDYWLRMNSLFRIAHIGESTSLLPFQPTGPPRPLAQEGDVFDSGKIKLHLRGDFRENGDGYPLPGEPAAEAMEHHVIPEVLGSVIPENQKIAVARHNLASAYDFESGSILATASQEASAPHLLARHRGATVRRSSPADGTLAHGCGKGTQ